MYDLVDLLGSVNIFKILLKFLSNFIPNPEQLFDGFIIHRFVSPSIKNCGHFVFILSVKLSNRS